MKKAKQQISTWALSLMLVVAGLFVSQGLKSAYLNHQFATEGKTTEGTILNKFTAQVSGGRHMRTAYKATYTYTAEGLEYRAQGEVMQSTWQTLDSGQTVSVLYLADTPGRSRIDSVPEENNYRRMMWLQLMPGLFMLVAFGGTIAYSIWNNDICKRLVNRGTPCTGQVTSVTSTVRGRQSGIEIQFSFPDNVGQKILGSAWIAKSMFGRSKGSDSWQEGDPIQVYYDPQKSSLFTVDLKRLS